jgi:hypothetical protein
VDRHNSVDESNEGNNGKNLVIQVQLFNPGPILTLGPQLSTMQPLVPAPLSPLVLTAIASGNFIQP